MYLDFLMKSAFREKQEKLELIEKFNICVSKQVEAEKVAAHER